jgi:hypothetical protein
MEKEEKPKTEKRVPQIAQESIISLRSPPSSISPNNNNACTRLQQKNSSDYACERMKELKCRKRKKWKLKKLLDCG